MTLASLETKLKTLTGTTIGQVLFDWSEASNELQTKTYPYLIWSISGASFVNDIRTSTIQKKKELTLSLFAVQSFDANTQSKITVWDTLEAAVNVYLNKVNEMSGISIANIDELNGEYYGEGLISIDSEIGMGYKNIRINMFC